MNVTFECPDCRAANRTELRSADPRIECGECNRSLPVRDRALDGDVVQACPLCGTEDLYLQKDFPHRLGLSIVAVGFLFSSWAWWQYKYPLALGILLATAALDLCLYYAIGDVLVCYRCLAQYRGAVRNRAHAAFDLAIGERYRQEKIRLEMLRSGSGRSAPERDGSGGHE